jgi:hypothetical protein
MNPRQARRERREAERKAKKAELRRIQASPASPEHGDSPEPFNTIIEGNSAAAQAQLRPELEPRTENVRRRRAETNRANSQFSTGPSTPEGKLASSRNSIKHGLASHQTIIRGEDPAAFEALLADLLAEHQPATGTECLLVHQMAQTHWLGQRALRLQNECFTEAGINEKRLALFLRYGTTHNRAFHKALADLHRLQKERRKSEMAHTAPRTGFASQPVAEAPEQPGFVSQNNIPPDVTTGFVPQSRRQSAA